MKKDLSMEQFKRAHAQQIEQVIKLLQTDSKLGLSVEESHKRCALYGLNRLKKENKNQLILQVIEQFKDPIIIVLLAACLLTFFLKKYDNTFVILLVVILNTCLGFFQQWKASKSIEALSSYLAQTAVVIRDGIKQSIQAKDLTIGDLIFLEAGQKIPADARLVETVNFTVDQSILTGESLPVEKDAKQIYPIDCLANHQNNMVFSGTACSTGRALAVITAIGSNTKIGEMSVEIEEIDETPSPLQVRLKKFSQWLTILILFFIGIIFVVGLMRGYDPYTLFLVAVSLIVTAIPEGLPLAVTLCLSSGIHLMAKRKAIVRRLAAVETLGSCNVICSDKTGTITSHQMMVNYLYVGKTLLEVTGHGYDPKGEVKGGANLDRLSMICAYTHECQIKEDAEGYTCIGDPTEGALVTLSKKIGAKEIQGISFDIPFESERRWMAVTVDLEKSYSVFIKGAMSEILKKSSLMLDEKGNEIAIDREQIIKAENELAAQGYRVIALAYADVNKKLSAGEIDHYKQFVFVGLAAISDPPREEVYSAIQKCKDAKIIVKMITGDFSITAKAIGEKIKIKEGQLNVLSGDELEKIPLDERAQKINETDVFARVLPKHKVMIVSALQQQGHVVAMTGDGVNDAASLKKADMGVAMGSGSDVAKESASLVILDDNFSTIVEAVKQGRVIFENLQRMILYLITTAISGVGVLMSTTFLGWSLPLLPIQLLWINLVTDGTSTIPLALEKGTDEVLKRPPYPKGKPIINKSLLLKMLFIGSYMSLGTLIVFYYSLYVLKDPLIKAQSLAFCTLAFFQILNVQCYRSI
jgi:Ca2+-transporting ATPase